MKSNQLKKALLSSGFILIMALAACSSGDKKSSASVSEDENELKTEQSSVPTFQDEKISRVYSDYITLKDALVASNEKDAGIAAGALQTSLIEASQKEAAELAAKITSAGSLASQREPFNALSSEVEKILKSSGIAGGTVYKQYCPMANGDEGGYWLANEKSIRNPYYGDEMMTCGTVKEEIK